MATNQEQIKCTITGIRKFDIKNGYAILECNSQGQKVVVKGTIPTAAVGDNLTVGGTWEESTQYGRQFIAENYEMNLPTDVNEIRTYLMSGVVDGMSKGIAHRLVTRYKENVFDILDQMPDELIHVPGVTPDILTRMRTSWAEKKQINNLAKFLNDNHIGATLATKIYAAYGKDSIETIKTNPYKMVDDIGLLFKTVDKIGSEMNIDKTDPNRLKYGVKYALKEMAAQGGHCCQNEDTFVTNCAKNLKVDRDILATQIQNMKQDKLVVSENGQIYLAEMHQAEQDIVSNMKRILSKPDAKTYDTKNLDAKLQNTASTHYNKEQINGIKNALSNKISILTGGPGTGKTTTTNGIVSLLEDAGANIILAAPTGRAAKKMQDATGKEAKTIHRLLEANKNGECKRNRDNQIEGDVLILDECSMIDTKLMANLLNAIPDNMKVIFIGDEDQLPSVGAGNVLHDMIDSGTLPVTKLTEVFRQASDSMIVTNAHRIRNGEPLLANKKDGDMFFINMDDPEQITDRIVDLVKTKLPAYYKISTDDIQVLAPTSVKTTGTENLNKKLQAAINPSTNGLKFGRHEYHENDRIIQTLNNYDKDVMNGDIGVIKSINQSDHSLVANFNGKDVEYSKDDLTELSPAFAITVHKSQGSEYPVVVIPIVDENTISLQRNMLYTAVTRAKQCCIVIGSEKAVNTAIQSTKAKERRTGLISKLQNTLSVDSATSYQTQDDKVALAETELGTQTNHTVSDKSDSYEDLP